MSISENFAVTGCIFSAKYSEIAEERGRILWCHSLSDRIFHVEYYATNDMKYKYKYLKNITRAHMINTEHSAL